MAQQTFNVAENVRVEILNCHNRVTVIGWDEAQRVSVDYSARQEGDTIIVENADKVMVRVPHRTAINITDCEADVRVEDVEGRVELTHIGGDVSLRNLRGESLACDVDGDLMARNVESLQGEGSWDGDVGLHNVKSFVAAQIEGSLAMNDIGSAAVDEVEGDVVAKDVRSLKGSGQWEGDVMLRDVESTEINDIEGDVTISELGSAKIQSVDGDFSAFNIRGSLAIVEVKGDVNLREISGNVSLDRVEGDFIASGVRNLLQVVDVEGDAVVSMAEIAQMELRADGDVVINLPENGNAEVELDALRGHLVAHADIDVDHEDENHLSGKLGSGGAKIRAESARGDLILRAGGTRRHHGHEGRGDEFADMGRRISQEVRESMRESFKGWRVQAHPKIKIKNKGHWGGWRHDRGEEEHEEETTRSTGPSSEERQAILDAIARGELNVDDAIKKLRGEE